MQTVCRIVIDCYPWITIAQRSIVLNFVWLLGHNLVTLVTVEIEDYDSRNLSTKCFGHRLQFLRKFLEVAE